MILAAGLGKRMRPLTNTVPKPLLPVGDSTLIELHLNKLAQAGINDVVINTSYLAEKIESALGSGESYGLTIHYSRESEALETAGGVQHALPLLDDDVFLLLNGDVWSDFPLKPLIDRGLHKGECAHLVLVDNPEHNPDGDFSLGPGGELLNKNEHSLTFSGISLLSPKSFQQTLPSSLLVDLFKQMIREQEAQQKKLISAQHYRGKWIDVGTPERLEGLRKLVTNT